jgi:hypothetical protein
MSYPEKSLRKYVHSNLDHLRLLRKRDVNIDELLTKIPPQSVVLDDGSKLELTCAPPEALTFKPIELPPDWARRRPLTVAFDPSSSMSVVGKRGNMRLLLIKPLAVAADGDVCSLSNRFREQRLFITLASNKEFDAPPGIRDMVLFDHFALQHEQQNALKHVKETAILVGPLEECVDELARYQYRYTETGTDRRVIVMRDGSILSNAENIVADYLRPKATPTGAVFDRMWLHQIIRSAAEEHGIPIVGVTKDAQAPIISQFFDEPGHDYTIMRHVARRQGVEFAILPPIRRTWPDSPLAIDYYFLFLERNVSCLRIEVVSSAKLRDARWMSVVQDVVRLTMENLETLELNENRYRLPRSLAKADQLTRVRSAELHELASETAKALSVDFRMKIVSERA